MALVIFRTRKEQNKYKFKEKIQHYQFDLMFMESVRLVLYFNRVFNLYELTIVKYLAFHMELQKRGMATIPSGQTQILLFLPIIRSVPS